MTPPNFTFTGLGTAVDIGAGDGAFALRLAEAGTVVNAYEPDPERYARLVKNTTRSHSNGTNGTITCWPIALGSTPRSVVLDGEVRDLLTPDDAREAEDAGRFIADADGLAAIVFRHVPGDESEWDPPFTTEEKAARDRALHLNLGWEDPLGVDGRRLTIRRHRLDLVRVAVPGPSRYVVATLLGERSTIWRSRRWLFDHGAPEADELNRVFVAAGFFLTAYETDGPMLWETS